MSSIKYRPDIDGLRALAVLSVLVFHLDASYLSGGFLGVDVFFVISGYLITSIIYKQKMQSSFSYSEFYIRRIKRILPPLFLVLFVTLAAGYVLMLPYDFFKMGISAGSILVFASNMQFALRAGDYFSSSSTEWPLLHTWSLAVEEQYYFIFPLILFLLLKFAKNHLNVLLALITLSSFALAEYMSRTSGLSSASYYLIVTRMGELLIGSILAIAHQRQTLRYFENQFLAVISLAVILSLMFFVDKTVPFPGFIALMLCIPVAIIINSKNTLINTLFENKAVIYIGLLSYSLYLFHWPVLALFRYLFNVTGDNYSLNVGQQFLAISIIITLTLFSYYCVEKPARKLKLSHSKTVLYYFALPTLTTAVLVFMIFSSKGLPERLSSKHIDASKQFSHIDVDKCPSLIKVGCVGGEKSATKHIAFFGNSHAEHYYDYVSDIAKHHHYSMSLFASGGCDVQATSSKCAHVREAYISELSRTDIAVIAFRWDSVLLEQQEIAALENLIKLTKEKDIKVVLLAQPPVLLSNPGKLFNCERFKLSCEVNEGFKESYPAYNESINKITLKYQVKFFDPYDLVSDKFQLYHNDRLNYFDDDHLSIYGNMWLFESYKGANFSTPFNL
ncbi:MAG: acyltransferase family protein [Colwellia sp.]